MSTGGGQMTADVEDVVDGRVAGKETLRRSGRSETLHLSLSSSDRDVRTLSPVVQPLAATMDARKAKVTESGIVRAITISDDPMSAQPPGSSAACASSTTLHPYRAWLEPEPRGPRLHHQRRATNTSADQQLRRRGEWRGAVAAPRSLRTGRDTSSMTRLATRRARQREAHSSNSSKDSTIATACIRQSDI